MICFCFTFIIFFFTYIVNFEFCIYRIFLWFRYLIQLSKFYYSNLQIYYTFIYIFVVACPVMITNFMVWYLQISFLKSLRSVKPNKWHKFFSTKIHLFSLTQTTVQVIKLYYVEQYITHKHIHDTIVAHYFWHHWNLYDVPHVTEKKKLESIFHQKGYCYLFQRQLVLISSHSLFWLICTEHLDASYSFGKCVHVL